MAQNGVTMKLLIDSKGKRVIFGEADKKVIDFLFHLLSLPLGTACKLLQGQVMVGSLENLYKSVETLDQTYFQADGQIRDNLLKPQVVSFCSSTMLLPCTADPPPLPTVYFCSHPSFFSNSRCRSIYSHDPNEECPSCGNDMSRQLDYLEPPTTNTTNTSSKKEEGYVKGVVSYMVMDDLRVMPMSTISCVTLLNKFKIKDVDALEEQLVTLTVDQVTYVLLYIFVNGYASLNYIMFIMLLPVNVIF